MEFGGNVKRRIHIFKGLNDTIQRIAKLLGLCVCVVCISNRVHVCVLVGESF